MSEPQDEALRIVEDDTLPLKRRLEAATTIGPGWYQWFDVWEILKALNERDLEIARLRERLES